MDNSINNLLHNLPDDFLENTYELGRITSPRNLLNSDEEHYVSNLAKGEHGEETIRTILTEETSLGSCYLQNLKLIKRGDMCEVDGVIPMRHKWFIIEVKNYFGVVEIDQWETWQNGSKVRNNPMNRTSKMKNIVEEIIRDFKINVELEFIIVFTNPHCDLRRVNSPLPIKYLTSNQLLHYFKEIDNEATYQHYSDDEFEYWRNRLSYYSYKFESDRIKRENFNWARFEGGLGCPKCKDVNMDILKYKCQCRSCGATYSKDYTLVANIIDHCIVHRTTVFSMKGLRRFIGNSLDRTYISKIVRKYFKVREDYTKKYYLLR